MKDSFSDPPQIPKTTDKQSIVVGSSEGSWSCVSEGFLWGVPKDFPGLLIHRWMCVASVGFRKPPGGDQSRALTPFGVG